MTFSGASPHRVSIPDHAELRLGAVISMLQKCCGASACGAAEYCRAPLRLAGDTSRVYRCAVGESAPWEGFWEVSFAVDPSLCVFRKIWAVTAGELDGSNRSVIQA